jgi:hypothetical protein
LASYTSIKPCNYHHLVYCHCATHSNSCRRQSRVLRGKLLLQLRIRDLRELQRHCRIDHGIPKQNFDYRCIGPPQHLADIQPLRKAQVSRQKREARKKKKRAALRNMEPVNNTQTPQVTLPALKDQQLAQSIQMINIIDSTQNICKQALPTATQTAPTSYHSLNTSPINKVVDHFNLAKELEPGFKTPAASKASRFKLLLPTSCR